MRRLRVALLAAVPVSVIVACTTPDDDAVDTSASALKSRDIDLEPITVKPPPPKPDAGVKPPVKVLPDIKVVGDFEPAWCGTSRFDLRRLTRACEDLPGAYVENGVTYVPGTSGRFKVTRLLAGTTAPPEVQAKTCSYEWEPQSCSAPDKTVLLKENTEQLVPRPPACEHFGPAGCMIEMPPIEVKDGGIPTGIGRCEVCGVSWDNQMYAVLPAGWTSFSYWAGGERKSVTLSTEQTSYQTSIGSSVAPANVTIYKYDSAPLDHP